MYTTLKKDGPREYVVLENMSDQGFIIPNIRIDTE
jgi:hypothetical protein